MVKRGMGDSLCKVLKFVSSFFHDSFVSFSSHGQRIEDPWFYAFLHGVWEIWKGCQMLWNGSQYFGPGAETLQWPGIHAGQDARPSLQDACRGPGSYSNDQSDANICQRLSKCVSNDSIWFGLFECLNLVRRQIWLQTSLPAVSLPFAVELRMKRVPCTLGASFYLFSPHKSMPSGRLDLQFAWAFSPTAGGCKVGATARQDEFHEFLSSLVPDLQDQVWHFLSSRFRSWKLL